MTTALSDRYRIERELGQGGMATVYLAQDLRHDRQVAIKVLRPELAAVIGAERFLAEIKTTANLQHPNIVPLFDSGVVPGERDGAPGSPFYVMPFVEGETLRELLDREKQLPLPRGVEIARQVAAALSYAHARGVVHRDIKPDNIMLSSGQAVVTDFGIARALGAAGGEQLTATGTAIGTPAYMSPEQSAGESDVDGRSDLYSLAAVLFEALAGEPPHTGPNAGSIIAKRLSTPAPSVQVLRSTVPDRLNLVLRKAMERSPTDRFATVAEFSAALDAEAPAPASRRFAVPLVTLGVLALAAIGWWALRPDRMEGNLDDNVIAVLPFRVGGDPAIAYLRESMLDLLNARLTGETGPRTVEPRTVLSAWRRATSDESTDLSEADSRQLAAGLGAGRLLLGSAVATPTELTLNASLLRVRDGAVMANGVVIGAPDSIAVLVNRLTARLLSLDAGESRERLDGLAAVPLPALQDYLAGRKAYRRGDYLGAMDLYASAFARDSGFAQAAFGLAVTNPHIGTVVRTDGFAVIPALWRLRDRLAPRDVELLRGMQFIGPNYPQGSTTAESIDQAEVAAAGAPDSPEHWFQLGVLLHSSGAAAGISDWAARSAEALDRAIALDSSFTPAIDSRLFVATWTGDFPVVRRLRAVLEGPVQAGFADGAMLWVAATALGDTAAARRWLTDPGKSPLTYSFRLVKVALHSVTAGMPLADARWANATLRRTGATATERNAAQLGEFAVALAEGHMTPLATFMSGTEWGDGWREASLVRQVVVEPQYASQLPALFAEPRMDSWLPVRDCFVEIARIQDGDTSGTRAAIRRLRAFAASDPAPLPREQWAQLEFRVCPLLLEAMLEPATTLPASGESALDRLEDLMERGPQWRVLGPPTSPAAIANFIIARKREAQGDLRGALAAIRRRESNYYPEYLWTIVPFLRQEGRLAALVGDTTGALWAYDRFLALRTDPDPVFRPQWDSVVAERAALRPPR